VQTGVKIPFHVGFLRSIELIPWTGGLFSHTRGKMGSLDSNTQEGAYN